MKQSRFLCRYTALGLASPHSSHKRESHKSLLPGCSAGLPSVVCCACEGCVQVVVHFCVIFTEMETSKFTFTADNDRVFEGLRIPKLLDNTTSVNFVLT